MDNTDYKYLEKIFFDLIEVQSESKREQNLALVIEGELKKFGFLTWYDSAGENIGGNTGNLWGKLEATGESLPTIMLNAHMDTVHTGKKVKYSAENRIVQGADNLPFGADDKAGIAIILQAIKKIIDKHAAHGEIIALFTVAEEIGLMGAKNANFDGMEIELAYILDSHGNAGTIINSAPTQKSINLTFKGKPAHAGVEPEKGINSIQAAAKAISQMKIGRIDELSTVNVGIIKGGSARNIVPAVTEIKAEARSLDDNALEKMVDGIIDTAHRASSEAGTELSYEIINEYSGYRWSDEDYLLQRAVKAAEMAGIKPVIEATGGGSDTNIFNANKIPSIVLSAGYINPHSSEEKADIGEMEICVDWLINILTLSEEVS